MPHMARNCLQRTCTQPGFVIQQRVFNFVKQCLAHACPHKDPCKPFQNQVLAAAGHPNLCAVHAATLPTWLISHMLQACLSSITPNNASHTAPQRSKVLCVAQPLVPAIQHTNAMLTPWLVLVFCFVPPNLADSSLFGASQFSITGSPIAGLENLSSDVPYVLDKLRANTFGNGTTNTDGGIRQCYEKLPGGGSTGILTRGYTNPSLPRMIMLLTDGLPNRRDFDSVPNNATCPCFISPGAAENNCRSCAREVATKRGA